MDPHEGADAFAVFIIEVEAMCSLDLVVNARLLHLEARGVDEDVELVLFALKYRPLLGDLSDALASGVDQMDIRPVEGGEVFIVEARALAHKHVPRLERLGR